MAHKILLKARLILLNEGKVLLMKQKASNGGKYTMVGGTVEDFEFAKISLIRESKEEVGLTLVEKDLKLVHTLHKKKGAVTRIVLYFQAVHWKGEPKALEPKKFKKVDWFDLKELPSPISPTVKHVLHKYMKGVNYSEYSA